MTYSAYHGSPNRPFTTFDLTQSGRTSGLNHAKGCLFFTSQPEVAVRYSKPSEFVGRFTLTLDNALDMDDDDREASFSDAINIARQAGHDGLILRRCVHAAISPGMRSDIFVLFDATRAQRDAVEVDNAPLV